MLRKLLKKMHTKVQLHLSGHDYVDGTIHSPLTEQIRVKY